MEDKVEQLPAARRRRWPRLVAVVLLVPALLLAGLWLARKPIASGYADRWLARAQVPVRYKITNLGLGRQRLTGVVIGDPAHPDLVAGWIETRTGWSLLGPYLAQVRGGHIRARARWVNGRLSFGSIDRLLPAPSGKPFALPALNVDLADARVRIETPWGVVGAKVTGAGRLDGGFAGQVALTGHQLGGACGVDAPFAALRVTTATDAVRLNGPVGFAAGRCAGAVVTVGRAQLDANVSLGRTPSWRAQAQLTAQSVVHPHARAALLSGRVDAQGGTGDLRGSAALRADRLGAAGVTAIGARLAGNWRYAAGAFAIGGSQPGARLTAVAVRLPGPILARVAALPAAAAGTPLAPLGGPLAAALVRAGRQFSLDADLVARAGGPGGTALTVHRAVARTPRGAEVALLPGSDLSWFGGALRVLRGTVSTKGDGLPTAVLRLAQRGVGAPLQGHAVIASYTAGDASLALGPVDFAQEGGGWHVQTRATVSGPLANGRVDALTLPIDAHWHGGALTLAGGCAPVSWAEVTMSGLQLDRGGLRLCPDAGPLVTLAGGRLAGGAQIGAARLTGRLGATPLSLAASGAQVSLGARGFALRGVDARLGSAARVTRLLIAALDGRATPAGIAGHFTGGGGQIGAVPLLISDAAGDWHYAGGALTLGGALRVADTTTPARFQPMVARDVSLRLAGNRITAQGVLHEPTTGVRVADISIHHDLTSGAGAAELTVRGLTFAKTFQPALLTMLTYGVIADVRGTVMGQGRIAWSPAGVTSTGDFRTPGVDLAAAFGPVEGLAGAIHFTDLLALQSAPGQRVTVKSINPGIPVTDGVVTFQTLPGTRLRVEDARWPFAGGTLVLDPTLLDFSAAAQRRLTFRVTGAETDKFLQQFDFKNLNATGGFDGVLPMLFDASGGRIENGRLAVRPGGGTIAYVGAVSQKNLGFWGNFAFDTLKSLRYRSLAIVMNGPLAGEMVTEVRFAGISQGVGAKSNFLIRRLQRLPIVFNIRIRAPFRGLLDATASFYDPKRLIQRALPQLLEQQNKAIQPPASETVP